MNTNPLITSAKGAAAYQAVQDMKTDPVDAAYSHEKFIEAGAKRWNAELADHAARFELMVLKSGQLPEVNEYRVNDCLNDALASDHLRLLVRAVLSNQPKYAFALCRSLVDTASEAYADKEMS